MSPRLPLPLLLGLAACAGAPEPAPFDQAACFVDLAKVLSDDALEGRGTGTPAFERAMDEVQKRFDLYGIAAPEGGPRQAFEVVVGVELENSVDHPGPANWLELGPQAAGPSLALEADFMPLGFSGSGTFDAELVFAGYGIVDAERKWDDYAGIDVTGKVVLALRYEPGEKDPASPFDGVRPTSGSDLRAKAHQAKKRGAKALIFVTGPVGADESEPDKVPALQLDGPTSDAGLPVLQITRAVADRWLKDAGTDLLSLQKSIDEGYQPASRALGLGVRGEVQLKPTKHKAHNLLGFVKGAGPLAEEIVVVGAHLDHLGMGGAHSMTPDLQAIHNGADDNASGVAAVVCAAADHARRSSENRRSLLVMAFGAEELGLGGSGWYVDHPVLPLDKTVAMVNLDMVGRVRDGKLTVDGTDSSADWLPLLEPIGKKTGLNLTYGGDGYGPSDHMSFYEKQKPVIHLFSGVHPEYHTPDDDFALLNLEGGAQVTAFTADILTALTEKPGTMGYAASKDGPSMAGDSRGYGAYLGTIPDYTAMTGGGAEPGVLLSGVKAGGPADKAGIQGGDVLVSLAGTEIRNLYDMTFALRENKPGETVDVVVKRAGAEVKLRATLGKRGAAPTTGHGDDWTPKAGTDASKLLDPREKHLADLRQLTNGGENAEAYWSPDGKSLMFQWTKPGEGGCDQQYVLDLETGTTTLVSSGKGRTTCGYFSYPDGKSLIYATTEGKDPACPPPADHSLGYVWPLYDGFEIVSQPLGATDPKVLIGGPGYDAEATVCMADGRIVFTSTRSGDLDLWVADKDGQNPKQMTSLPGYDGGAFFTPDCSHIVWRASRPEGEARADYDKLLAQGMVRPSALELFRMKADGTEVFQLTQNGAANFGPYPYPDESAVIYASNFGGNPREFELFAVPWEGGESEQITFSPEFDGFPMFSPDGKWLVFASNRGSTDRQTNLFLARWVK